MTELAVIDPTVISAVSGALLGGGLLGGYSVWKKAGPEADQIVAKTLIEVNEYLRTELELRDKEIEQQREEIEKLRERLRQLRKDFNALEDEFHKLSRSVLREPPSAATS